MGTCMCSECAVRRLGEKGYQDEIRTLRAERAGLRARVEDLLGELEATKLDRDALDDRLEWMYRAGSHA